jgi:hypothetical protein
VAFFLNGEVKPADLKDMITTLLFMLALQVTTSAEMSCIGSVVDLEMPADLYVAGLQEEGIATMASQGQFVYINGPRVSFLKVGEINRVIRPEGEVHDLVNGKKQGTYYKDLGIIRIEAVNRDVATARVIMSCQGIIKGDLVTPAAAKPAVVFRGDLSNALTPFPAEGLMSSILLGKNDAQELAGGAICFIGRGWRDGVKVGDRFTVFRFPPPFDSNEKAVEATSYNMGSSFDAGPDNVARLGAKLSDRTLPKQILGDIVVVDVGDKTCTGKIINSISVMHPGDLVVKR